MGVGAPAHRMTEKIARTSISFFYFGRITDSIMQALKSIALACRSAKFKQNKSSSDSILLFELVYQADLSEWRQLRHNCQIKRVLRPGSKTSITVEC